MWESSNSLILNTLSAGVEVSSCFTQQGIMFCFPTVRLNHLRSSHCTSLRWLVIPSPIVSRDTIITPKPTLSLLKDSSGRRENKMRWSLSLDRQLLRLLWLQLKNWAPDVTTKLVLYVEPVSYQNAAASSQSVPTTFTLVPITLWGVLLVAMQCF
jgi:hypothetical protein